MFDISKKEPTAVCVNSFKAKRQCDLELEIPANLRVSLGNLQSLQIVLSVLPIPNGTPWEYRQKSLTC